MSLWIVGISSILLFPFQWIHQIECSYPHEIVQWRPMDITLSAKQDHPWWTFPVQALFVHDQSRSKITIEAYWDGSHNWTLRFAPTLPGVWKYTTISADEGLDDQSGAINVRAPSSIEIKENPNYRGFLKIAPNGRYFQYADGTPFFLLASTLWAGNTARCVLGENQDGPFFQYVDLRKSQGFTMILMQLFHGFGDYGYGNYPESLGQRNEGGQPFFEGDVTNLNPEFYKYLDQRIHAIWERGLTTATPTAWFGKTGDCKFTIEDAIRISCYLRVRYGAYNGLWALCGEYQYNFRDCNWTPEDVNRLGQSVQKHNPYDHPLSIHPSARADWPEPHNVQSSMPFHSEDWLDHHWLQTGQSIDRLYNIVIRAEENRAMTPARPVFHSEGYYERADNPDESYYSRWQVWAAFLSGCAGHGHGAMGIWQFYDPNEPMGETGKNIGVPWKIAMQFQGPSTLKHAASLLQSIGWNRLEPCRNALRIDGKTCPHPSTNELTPPFAAYIPNRCWIIYFPRGNAGRGITIKHPTLNSAMIGSWYNPRTGVWIKTNRPVILKDGNIPTRPKPSNEDWVMIFYYE